MHPPARPVSRGDARGDGEGSAGGRGGREGEWGREGVEEGGELEDVADPAAQGVLLFDIGGGSSEIVWLARGRPGMSHREPRQRRLRVTGLASEHPVGHLTLASH